MWIQAALMGDQQALEALVDKYHTLVSKICRFRIQNKEDADDCAMETWTKALSSLGKFQFRASFGTWVVRIAHNVCNDMGRSAQQRRRHAQVPYDDEIELAAPSNGQSAPPFPSPRSASIMQEFNECIGQMINTLSPDHQVMITAWLVEGKTCAEVAQEFDCSPEKVRTLIFRFRGKLKKRLNDSTTLLTKPEPLVASLLEK